MHWNLTRWVYLVFLFWICAIIKNEAMNSKFWFLWADLAPGRKTVKETNFCRYLILWLTRKFILQHFSYFQSGIFCIEKFTTFLHFLIVNFTNWCSWKILQALTFANPNYKIILLFFWSFVDRRFLKLCRNFILKSSAKQYVHKRCLLAFRCELNVPLFINFDSIPSPPEIPFINFGTSFSLSHVFC